MKTRSLSSAGVALFYFVSNVALAYSAETNLWAERRHRLNVSTPLVASLPTETTRLSAVLNPPLPSRPSLEALMTTGGGGGRPLSGLSQVLAALPASAVTLRQLVPARAGVRRQGAVILFQDVHLNLEAQEKIAQALIALDHLTRSGSRLSIGVEGAFGRFNFDRFAGLPDAAITRRVARYFLAAGRIAAPSFVGITGDAPSFQGVDDSALYAKNLDAVHDAEGRRASASEVIATAVRVLVEQKKAGLNAALRRFDDLRSAHRAGTLSLDAYVERLAVMAGGSTSTDLNNFIEASRLERSVDYGQVERDRGRVVEALVHRSTPDELRGLVDESLRYRAGEISYADFYRALSSLAERRGLSLAQTPAFAAYLRYVSLADAIRAENLFKAISDLESRIVDRLARTENERDLIRKDEAAFLATRLVAFSLTTDEWRRYRDLSAWSPLSRQRAAPFEAFYESADRRSDRIVENTLAMPARHGLRALLVGGFHAPAIAERLAARGIDVAILQPVLTKIAGVSGTEYLSIFVREKAPLERLLAGEKLFLAPSQLEIGDTDNAATQATADEIVHFDLAASALAGKSGTFPAGHSQVRTIAGSRVVDTTSKRKTLHETSDRTPRGYKDVLSGLPTTEAEFGLPALHFIRPTGETSISRALGRLIGLSIGVMAIALGVAGVGVGLLYIGVRFPWHAVVAFFVALVSYLIQMQPVAPEPSPFGDRPVVSAPAAAVRIDADPSHLPAPVVAQRGRVLNLFDREADEIDRVGRSALKNLGADAAGNAALLEGAAAAAAQTRALLAEIDPSRRESATFYLAHEGARDLYVTADTRGFSGLIPATAVGIASARLDEVADIERLHAALSSALSGVEQAFTLARADPSDEVGARRRLGAALDRFQASWSDAHRLHQEKTNLFARVHPAASAFLGVRLNEVALNDRASLPLAYQRTMSWIIESALNFNDIPLKRRIRRTTEALNEFGYRFNEDVVTVEELHRASEAVIRGLAVPLQPGEDRLLNELIYQVGGHESRDVVTLETGVRTFGWRLVPVLRVIAPALTVNERIPTARVLSEVLLSHQDVPADTLPALRGAMDLFLSLDLPIFSPFEEFGVAIGSYGENSVRLIVDSMARWNTPTLLLLAANTVGRALATVLPSDSTRDVIDRLTNVGVDAVTLERLTHLVRIDLRNNGGSWLGASRLFRTLLPGAIPAGVSPNAEIDRGLKDAIPSLPDVDLTAFLRAHEVSLGADGSIPAPTLVLGRTMYFQRTDGHFLALKFLRNNGERPNELLHESYVQSYLQAHQTAWKLQSHFPTAVVLNAADQRVGRLVGVPSNVESTLATSAVPVDPSRTFIAYVAEPAYTVYAQNAESDQAFTDGVDRALHDLAVEARNGIVHTTIFDVTHTLGVDSSRDDRGAFLWNVDAMPVRQVGVGTGDIPDPEGVLRFGNIRESGEADLGDMRGYRPKSDRFSPSFNMAYWLGSYLMAVSQLKGFQMLNAGKLRDWKNEAEVQEIADWHLERFARFAAAYTGIGAAKLRAYLAKAVDWRALGRQMIFFMGKDEHDQYHYYKYIVRELPWPVDIYPDTQVKLSETPPPTTIDTNPDSEWREFIPKVGWANPHDVDGRTELRPQRGPTNGPFDLQEVIRAIYNTTLIMVADTASRSSAVSGAVSPSEVNEAQARRKVDAASDEAPSDLAFTIRRLWVPVIAALVFLVRGWRMTPSTAWSSSLRTASRVASSRGFRYVAAPVLELPFTMIDAALWIIGFILPLPDGIRNFFLNLHGPVGSAERVRQERGLLSMRLAFVAGIIAAVALVAVVSLWGNPRPALDIAIGVWNEPRFAIEAIAVSVAVFQSLAHASANGADLRRTAVGIAAGTGNALILPLALLGNAMNRYFSPRRRPVQPPTDWRGNRVPYRLDWRGNVVTDIEATPPGEDDAGEIGLPPLRPTVFDVRLRAGQHTVAEVAGALTNFEQVMASDRRPVNDPFDSENQIFSIIQTAFVNVVDPQSRRIRPDADLWIPVLMNALRVGMDDRSLSRGVTREAPMRYLRYFEEWFIDALEVARSDHNENLERQLMAVLAEMRASHHHAPADILAHIAETTNVARALSLLPARSVALTIDDRVPSDARALIAFALADAVTRNESRTRTLDWLRPVFDQARDFTDAPSVDWFYDRIDGSPSEVERAVWTEFLRRYVVSGRTTPLTSTEREAIGEAVDAAVARRLSTGATDLVVEVGHFDNFGDLVQGLEFARALAAGKSSPRVVVVLDDRAMRVKASPQPSQAEKAARILGLAEAITTPVTIDHVTYVANSHRADVLTRTYVSLRTPGFELRLQPSDLRNRVGVVQLGESTAQNDPKHLTGDATMPAWPDGLYLQPGTLPDEWGLPLFDDVSARGHRPSKADVRGLDGIGESERKKPWAFFYWSAYSKEDAEKAVRTMAELQRQGWVVLVKGSDYRIDQLRQRLPNGDALVVVPFNQRAELSRLMAASDMVGVTGTMSYAEAVRNAAAYGIPFTYLAPGWHLDAIPNLQKFVGSSGLPAEQVARVSDLLSHPERLATATAVDHDAFRALGKELLEQKDLFRTVLPLLLASAASESMFGPTAASFKGQDGRWDLESQTSVESAPGLVNRKTFAAAIRSFMRYGFLGRPAEWKIAALASVRESLVAFAARIFFQSHENATPQQAAWRMVGIGFIYLGAIVGAVSGFALFGSAPELARWTTAIAGVWLGAVTFHLVWDLAPLVLGHSLLTPEQRAILAAAQAAHASGDGADRVAVVQLLSLLPEIRNLRVSDGLDLRDEAGVYLHGQMIRGRRASEVLPELAQLARTPTEEIAAYADVARPAFDAPDATVNVRVIAEGTPVRRLEAEIRREVERRRETESAETLVFAVSGDDEDTTAALALDGRFGLSVRVVRNDASLSFEPQALETRLGLSALKKINIFVGQNATLSPEALESLQTLERLKPQLASLYLLIETVTRVAVPVTLAQLGEMARLRRLIETQA